MTYLLQDLHQGPFGGIKIDSCLGLSVGVPSVALFGMFVGAPIVREFGLGSVTKYIVYRCVRQYIC